MNKAKTGDTVKINYTGTLTDGTVFDSSEGRDPLTFTLGRNELIPGFEEAVLGMTVGEAKTITIPFAKAYGARNEELVIRAPRDQVPHEITPELGLKLQLSAPNGEMIMVTVVELTDDEIVLDANPPLAGKDLTFAIEVVAIS